MKLYNCPDCTHTENTCENCTRFLTYHRSNINNIKYDYDISNWHYISLMNIPPACRNCPNHPINGGSGNCNCTLGDPTIY